MRIDPRLQPIFDATAAAFKTRPHLMAPVAYRELSDALSAKRPRALPPDALVEKRLADPQGRRVPVRIYRVPESDPSRILVYIHGGGWMISRVDLHDDVCCEIAQRALCTVISVGYSLAPENPYPAALLDCHAAVEWLLTSLEFASPSRRIVVGGGSAGGNLAAALCLKYRDEAGSTPFAMQWLLYPVLDVDFDRPSYLHCGNGPGLTGDTMRYFWEHYIQGSLHTVHCYGAPCRASDLTALPPAFVVAAEHDPLRDEATEYAARLLQSGINVEYRLAPGLVHGFVQHRSVSLLAASEFRAACAALLRLFSEPTANFESDGGVLPVDATAQPPADLGG